MAFTLIDLIERGGLFRSQVNGPYDAFRALSSRIDYLVAYNIDRFRRQRLKGPQMVALEQDLAAQIDALQELIQTVPPEAAATLKHKSITLQNVLIQVKGSTAATAPPSSTASVSEKGRANSRPRSVTSAVGTCKQRIYEYGANTTRIEEDIKWK